MTANQDENSGGLEFRARLLKDEGGYYYAVEASIGNARKTFGRFTNAADAKDAAYLSAQRHGGTMVYLGKGRAS